MSQKYDLHELLNTSSYLRSRRLSTEGNATYSSFGNERIVDPICALNAEKCDTANFYVKILEGRTSS
jgi:hypothetical protein